MTEEDEPQPEPDEPEESAAEAEPTPSASARPKPTKAEKLEAKAARLREAVAPTSARESGPTFSAPRTSSFRPLGQVTFTVSAAVAAPSPKVKGSSTDER